MRWIFCCLMLLPAHAVSGTIYLCKTYSGGAFWSSTHCRQHNALIERLVSVPDTLPFQQQVELAEQARAAGRALVHAPTLVHPQQQDASKQAECDALRARIAHNTAMARRPQPAQMQDWLAKDKREARTMYGQLRC